MMKKIMAAILMFDVIMGLLLFGMMINKQGEKAELTGGEAEVRGSMENRDGMEIRDSQEMKQVADEAGATEKKKIALTFDDGPHPSYTEELLDGLKERGVVATFFVTGEHAVLHPDIIKRMQEEGHLIGNHTYSHMQLQSNNLDEFKEELVATSEVVEEIIGEEVVYVRPPYGIWDKSLEAELNMIPVLWNIDPLDWCSNDASRIADKVITKAGEDDIILMHDYYESSVDAALKIVDELQAQGYEFVTVEEILFE